MRQATTMLALAALIACGAATAQAPSPRQAAQDPTEQGFFRPARDPSLNAPVAPSGAATLPPAASEESRRAAASLERIEATVDRLETTVANATAPPAPLPPITSPLDGTAPILSPIDGTAPIITPTAR